MRYLLCISVVLALAACGQQTTANNTQQATDTVAPAVPDKKEMSVDSLFTNSDAEKILGEPAHMTEGGTSVKNDTTVYNATYTANAIDAKTNKTGNIYFMFERYGKEQTAHDLYEYFRKANEANGINVLDGIGDEAYFHTDGQNFYFIMARRGAKMIRMKVNKLTSKTSKEEFMAVAKNIVSKF
ncbi:MAG: hypothetical protein K0Q79_1541 [Flavipsychrobacter sp.]|jgi:hypothetical protein|nr:hypothetical protein [Flavipsychrobacter sp.]